MNSATDNRTTELLQELRDLTEDVNPGAIIDHINITRRWLDLWHTQFDRIVDELEQTIAATLESDDGYEAKMDALLCRLTNGKFSKSRAYDLDFMESCVNEEYEMLYADELNAVIDGGECEWTLKEEWPNRSGDDHVYGYETSCGARHTWWPDSLPNFCPTCGGRVKAVKQ